MKNFILVVVFSIISFSTYAQVPPRPSLFTQSKVTVCQGETGVVYTVPVVAGATSYIWTYYFINIPATAVTINGINATTVEVSSANGGNSVTIDYGVLNVNGGTLSVSAKNASVEKVR